MESCKLLQGDTKSRRFSTNISLYTLQDIVIFTMVDEWELVYAI